jgi:hypothetical protein
MAFFKPTYTKEVVIDDDPPGGHGWNTFISAAMGAVTGAITGAIKGGSQDWAASGGVGFLVGAGVGALAGGAQYATDVYRTSKEGEPTREEQRQKVMRPSEANPVRFNTGPSQYMQRLSQREQPQAIPPMIDRNLDRPQRLDLREQYR